MIEYPLELLLNLGVLSTTFNLKSFRPTTEVFLTEFVTRKWRNQKFVTVSMMCRQNTKDSTLI